MVDELRVRRDECLSYKQQLQLLQQQLEHERQLGAAKVGAVEQQIEVVQKQALSREEEQQVGYLQRETRHANEQARL